MSTSNVWSYRSDLTATNNAPSQIVGYAVEASDGHIGKVDGASTETSRQYIVVDTGFWIFGKKRLIPVGVITRIDHTNEAVYVSLTKDEIKNAPDYDEMSESNDAYYDKQSGYYGQYGW